MYIILAVKIIVGVAFIFSIMVAVMWSRIFTKFNRNKYNGKVLQKNRAY